jgi:hypothetical protein
MTDYWLPQYQMIRDYFTRYGLDDSYYDYIDYYAAGLLGYVTHGDYATANQALELMLDQVGAPLDPSLLADPSFLAAGSDTMLRYLISSLDGNGLVGDRIDAQVEAVILNRDGARGWKTRRLTVDLLKQRQTTAAYRLLLDARDQLGAQVAAGDYDGDELLQAQDLLARIDHAVDPYFIQ